MSGAVSVTINDGIVRVVIDRPDRGNALDEATVEALIEALETASSSGARALVFEGNGRHFCTGFDLPASGATDAVLLHRFVRIELFLQSCYRAPFITMAVAHGRTFGAGADLFAACDRRIALSDASFAFPGAGFGILLGTRRLVARTGADAARTLIRTGQTIGADEAMRINLANLAATPETVEALIETSARVVIDPQTLSGLHQVSNQADDDKALAELVRTAGRPGLAARVAAYREKVMASKRN